MIDAQLPSAHMDILKPLPLYSTDLLEHKEKFYGFKQNENKWRSDWASDQGLWWNVNAEGDSKVKEQWTVRGLCLSNNTAREIYNGSIPRVSGVLQRNNKLQCLQEVGPTNPIEACFPKSEFKW